MSKAVVATGIVVVGAVGASFYAQATANSALRREIASLREDVRRSTMAGRTGATTAPRSAASTDAATPTAPSAPARNEDLVQLRDEIVALRKSTTTLTQLAQTAQAAQALAKTSDDVPTNLIAAGD